MTFINLEKTYDIVPKDVLWWTLNKKTDSLKYVSIIRDMYEGVVTNVTTYGRLMDEFLIIIRVHHGLALSLFLYAIVMYKITKSFYEEILWCMLFANYIVLIDETK